MTNAGGKKRKAVMLGVGLDSDGHKRLTTGPNFALVGGTEATHEQMTEKAIKINEKTKARGKAGNRQPRGIRRHRPRSRPQTGQAGKPAQFNWLRRRACGSIKSAHRRRHYNPHFSTAARDCAGVIVQFACQPRAAPPRSFPVGRRNTQCPPPAARSVFPTPRKFWRPASSRRSGRNKCSRRNF